MDTDAARALELRCMTRCLPPHVVSELRQMRQAKRPPLDGSVQLLLDDATGSAAFIGVTALGPWPFAAVVVDLRQAADDIPGVTKAVFAHTAAVPDVNIVVAAVAAEHWDDQCKRVTTLRASLAPLPNVAVVACGDSNAAATTVVHLADIHGAVRALPLAPLQQDVDPTAAWLSACFDRKWSASWPLPPLLTRALADAAVLALGPVASTVPRDVAVLAGIDCLAVELRLVTGGDWAAYLQQLLVEAGSEAEELSAPMMLAYATQFAEVLSGVSAGQ
jgi:hypothetical protein